MLIYFIKSVGRLSSKERKIAQSRESVLNECLLDPGIDARCS